MHLLYYPNLRLLDPVDCLKAIQILGVRTAEIAELTGYSRPAVYAWTSGKPPKQIPVVNNVNELAYRVFAASAGKTLPVGLQGDQDSRVEAIANALQQISLTTTSQSVAPKGILPFKLDTGVF